MATMADRMLQAPSTVGLPAREHFLPLLLPEDRASGLPSPAVETAARDGRFEAEG
jgi:hypothetical protein